MLKQTNVALTPLDLSGGDQSIRVHELNVLSSMFLVVGDTMQMVARWAIGLAATRVAVSAKRLCY